MELSLCFVFILNEPSKCKFFYIADGFKLNVLVELKPIEHIPLTILASVGQGKWGKREGGEVDS